jgi:hypothetical protein
VGSTPSTPLPTKIRHLKIRKESSAAEKEKEKEKETTIVDGSDVTTSAKCLKKEMIHEKIQ